MSVGHAYLTTVCKRFGEMKKTAEQAMNQVDPELLFQTVHEESNSIAIIVQHMSGNMISRWTNFFDSDGEKPDRDRDQEFIAYVSDRYKLQEYWELGWTTFFQTLDQITEDDLLRTIYIRKEAHTVMEAIERQMYHYSYHVGQIVFLAKWFCGTEWKSLTIPKKR